MPARECTDEEIDRLLQRVIATELPRAPTAIPKQLQSNSGAVNERSFERILQKIRREITCDG
jgi:hypothetical protein